MKVVIIYASRYMGNTKKVAQAIAEELGCDAKEISEVTPNELVAYEVIGVGSGVYAFGLDPRLRKLLSHVPNLSSKRIFIFSTSADPSGSKYHRGLVKWLKREGVQVLGEFNCPGEYRFWFFRRITLNRGRPSEKDLARAGEFARGLIHHVERTRSPEQVL